MSGTRDECVFMARLAEQAERFEDMVEQLVAKIAARASFLLSSELNLDERNLFSVAYKNSVGARRQAWRAVNTLEKREAAASKGAAILELVQRYREKVESELSGKCREVLKILFEELIPKAGSSESKVFYLKMKGRLRMQSSLTPSTAHDAYQSASETAISELPATHPVRLGLALNFSVFYYEVFSSPEAWTGEKACLLSKAAFDDAMAVMDSLDEDSYKDSAATRWIRCQGRPLSRLEGRVQRRRTQRCSARLSLDQANGHHFLPAGTMLDRSTVVLFEDVTTKPGLSLSFLSEVLPDGCSVTNESRLLEQLPPGCVAPRRSCSCSETISPFGPPTCRIPAAPRRPRHAPSSRARARAAPRGTHGTPVTRPRGGGSHGGVFLLRALVQASRTDFPSSFLRRPLDWLLRVP
ncbi:Protein BMH2 [Durusdinium trenchii]|uniref:Protein BMH2 n=1 Tax=Durusdinium trenchii TaxID=1381693 RepID=A0ABP0SNS5_9DINO